MSFPSPNILRDKFPTEMYSFVKLILTIHNKQKNKESKLIIVYDSEERLGIPHAQLLIQKGFDNIFFMSGGLEEFVKVYPEMCEGPGVLALIQAKAQIELLKQDGNYNNLRMIAPLRNTNKTGFTKMTGVKSRAKSSDKLTVVTSSKMSVVSGVSNTGNSKVK